MTNKPEGTCGNRLGCTCGNKLGCATGIINCPVLLALTMMVGVLYRPCVNVPYGLASTCCVPFGLWTGAWRLIWWMGGTAERMALLVGTAEVTSVLPAVVRALMTLPI